MKKLIALVLVLMLCVSVLPVGIMNVAAAERNITCTQDYPTDKHVVSGTSITTTESDIYTNGELTWSAYMSDYTANSETKINHIGFQRNADGVNTMNIQAAGTYAYVGARLSDPNKTFTGLVGGSFTINRITTNGDWIGANEMRYLVSAGQSDYFAFGMSSNTTGGNEAVPYYDIYKDGARVGNSKTYATSRIDSTLTTLTDKAKQRKMDVSFTVDAATNTVSFTIVTSDKASGAADYSIVDTWTSSFTVDSIATMVEETKYIQSHYVCDTHNEGSFTVDNPVVNITANVLEGKVYAPDFSAAPAAITTKPETQTDVYTDGSFKWTAEQRAWNSGEDTPVWTSLSIGKTNGVNTISANVEAIYLSTGAVLSNPDEELTMLKGGSVTIHRPIPITEWQGGHEMRYLASGTDNSSYFGFGIASNKLGNDDGKPFYRASSLDSGEKKYKANMEKPAEGTNRKMKVDFTVSGTTVNFTIKTYDKASGAADYTLVDTWTDSFIVSDMSTLVEKAKYTQVHYVTSNYGANTFTVEEPIINYDSIVHTPPTFTEDFENFTASDGATHFDYNGNLILGEDAEAKWELSRFIYGYNFDSSTNKESTPQSAGYIKNVSGNKKLTMLGSSTYAGANLYLKEKAYEYQKYQFDFGGRLNHYAGVRFLINDDEKSFFEIGFGGGATSKLYIAKFNGLWAENSYYHEVTPEDQTEAVPFYSDKITSEYNLNFVDKYGTADDPDKFYETQPEHTYTATIEILENGFNYDVSENGTSLWSGFYETEITQPDSGNPAISYVSCNNSNYNEQSLDNVKIWYTPVVEPNVKVNADDKLEAEFSLKQLNKAKVSVIVVHYNDEGKVVGAEVKSATDNTLDKNILTFDKVSDATKAKVYFWEGDAKEVKPFADEAQINY